MAQAEINFSNRQATGQQELAGAPGFAINVIVDDTGAIRRRPGLQAVPGIYNGVIDPTGLSGIYATIDGKLYAIGSTPGNRNIYRVTSIPTLLGTALSDSNLSGLLRPVFAETQLILAIAGGDKMQKIVLADDTSSRIKDEPPYASHVAANSSRLLGNIANVNYNNTFDKSIVRFSGIANGNSSFAGLEVWTEGVVIGGAGHFSAEANPDPVLAVYENTNEVFCFGTKSVQLFAPDPFVSDTGIPAGWSPSVTKELGCTAPYSIVKVNQMFFWLDDLRRFVMSDGRSEQVISDPIQKTIDDMPVVGDCYGYRVVVGMLDNMTWRFGQDGRTFSFQKGSGWAEWLSWKNGNWAPFPVTCSKISPINGANLVGDSSGRIGRLSLDATTDYGEPINARVETGYLDRGTDEKKHCRCVRVAMRRGQTTSAVGPVAYISWRDQPGPYGPPLAIDLGAQGDTHPVVELRSLGAYRRRQWRFEFSGTEPLELVKVTEEFDILAS
jgi:hypothetical protein